MISLRGWTCTTHHYACECREERFAELMNAALDAAEIAHANGAGHIAERVYTALKKLED